ncbi:response regulator [Lacinutrix sp. 5H-3-7-4]|uniref:response regulator n=1 Tax=Lacinutrix sp. (strain 5H-3-7-4) TaxID=983544 RepID=UPI00020A38E3|nr:response regulator [Lacinutrix sp. 5H-3-7-4]AEH01164.1 response regulator receiver protein [Lacinutrix sp. 5H-3-7-4]
MLPRTIRILMTDDHPMILEGYQITLKATKKENQTLIIDTANDCEESITAIKKSIDTGVPYDVYFFDISIPASKNGKYKSGLDLANYVYQHSPSSKIIILTMFDESFRIHKIINEINPEGFLIKSDLTSSELSSAFQRILNHEVFYSGTVNSILSKTLPSRLDIDGINHEILYLLSKGTKTKDLVKHFDLSLSSVEKRKKTLKRLFLVEDLNDDALINAAREKGFIN